MNQTRNPNPQKFVAIPLKSIECPRCFISSNVQPVSCTAVWKKITDLIQMKAITSYHKKKSWSLPRSKNIEIFGPPEKKSLKYLDPLEIVLKFLKGAQKMDRGPLFKGFIQAKGTFWTLNSTTKKSSLQL